MDSNRSVETAWWTLRMALGLTAFLAGLDKFFNILTNWTLYLNPFVERFVDGSVFMRGVGVIEIVAGLLLLSGVTRFGGYLVSAWLVGIALNLLTMGQYFDVAARDLVLAASAFTLAKLSEAREPATAVSAHARVATAPAR